MISLRKYNLLKIVSKGALTENEVKDMKDYVSSQKKSEPTDQAKEYFARLYEETDDSFNITYEYLLKKFLIKFKEIERVDFNNGIDDVNFKNLQTILYYFVKDERFFKCDNLTDISTPSFDKGLLVVGTYGNGKTAMMKTLKHLFNNTPLTFKMYTTNKIVSTFESYQDSAERNDYLSRVRSGTTYLDDVKTEKIASNYGKHNLLKEILEERYNNKSKTFITCNYKEDDSAQDINTAIKEFGEKYGARVYDRMFEMFNIIEFNGKSLRK